MSTSYHIRSGSLDAPLTGFQEDERGNRDDRNSISSTEEEDDGAMNNVLSENGVTDEAALRKMRCNIRRQNMMKNLEKKRKADEEQEAAGQRKRRRGDSVSTQRGGSMDMASMSGNGSGSGQVDVVGNGSGGVSAAVRERRQDEKVLDAANKRYIYKKDVVKENSMLRAELQRLLKEKELMIQKYEREFTKLRGLGDGTPSCISPTSWNDLQKQISDSIAITVTESDLHNVVAHDEAFLPMEFDTNHDQLAMIDSLSSNTGLTNDDFTDADYFGLMDDDVLEDMNDNDNESGSTNELKSEGDTAPVGLTVQVPNTVGGYRALISSKKSPSHFLSPKSMRPSSRSISESESGANDYSTNTGRWTLEEQRLFIDGLEKHGRRWDVLSQMIKTRSVIQIRSHAQKYFRKMSVFSGFASESSMD